MGDSARAADAPAASNGQNRDEVLAAPPAMLAPTHWENNEGEEDASEADSSFGDDNGSSTASLSSSILEYRVINGRTYHAERGDAQYWASNDAKANESLDVIHHTSTLLLNGRMFLAPLKKDSLTKVLDIGTGTGIWAIDFGDEFPEAEVVGTDVSPIQPLWVPPNVKFEIEDFTLDWTFPDDSADYVHMRFLYGSVPDWAALYKRAYRVCKPGGWVESHEGDPMGYSDDGTLKEGSALAEWGKFFHEGGKKLGRVFTPLPGDLQEKGLREAGFVDIQFKTFKVPVGDWPKDETLKEIGRFTQLGVETDAEGHITFMANLLDGWTQDKVALYCVQLRRELRNKRIHAYYHQRVVWGRKPEAVPPSEA
ncbi:S-adenosyl-L-methionine-dependent methyltransferase [Dactylonectria macrodidyma]|uniref:S-adenosyl-L-methionine-dependent methyltransferase n=1 Tax=Dactylonectria macrodidyma TaxID=307937 RepID=A0A9P9DJX9_9HYPO|nr:S-adenosyl-L-methionine-dependent methyltransferase [Dactylonectria macrodidyma]